MEVGVSPFWYLERTDAEGRADFAGSPQFFPQTCSGMCYNDYVINNGTSQYANAYFDVGYVRVFSSAPANVTGSGSPSSSGSGSGGSGSSGGTSGGERVGMGWGVAGIVAGLMIVAVDSLV